MEENITSLKKTARLAGFLYLVGGIVAAWGLMYAPYNSTIKEDSFTITQKILSNEFLFRTKILSNLVGAIIFFLLAFELYRLFKNVNGQRAKILVAFTILQMPIIFVLESFHVVALMLLKGVLMKSLAPEQVQDLAMLFIKMNSYGVGILEIFWGLWLIPFGQLVYESGFIPRILGIFLVLGGLAYIFDSFTFILFPEYKAIVSRFAIIFWSLAEIPIMFWLLIIGVKVQRSNQLQHQLQ